MSLLAAETTGEGPAGSFNKGEPYSNGAGHPLRPTVHRKGGLFSPCERSFAAQFLAGDRASVHRVGTIDNAQHRGPGIELGQQCVVAHAALAPSRSISFPRPGG